MQNPLLRVLVVESQVLIAMEIEQILTENLGCAVTVTTLARYEDVLSDGPYDVVLVDAAPSKTTNLARVERIRAVGAAAVLLSSYEDFARQDPSTADLPKIDKPFDPSDLVAIVREAASRPGQRQEQSESRGASLKDRDTP